MSDKLTIDFKPLGREKGNSVDRAFYADIGLMIGGDWLTLLEDVEAQTVRPHLRGCAYHLATWFAANWWRLRWEPEARSWREDADWRVAHSVAGAGGGYVWPNVLFASDGDSLAVASLPRTRVVAFEPIRYLNRIQARITAAEFEQKVDAFMEGVLSRLHALGIEGESLPALWAEVLAERGEAAAYHRRKLEAMAGFDPDQAPDELLAQFLEDKAKLGQGALEEVAAEARHAAADVLQPILELAKAKTPPKAGGFRGTMPTLANQPPAGAGERPWQRAAQLAGLARTQWGLGRQPIDDKALADLLGTKATVFSDRTKSPAPMPLALRTGTNGSLDLYFNSAWSTSRRFATSRVIGDHLYFTNQGRLIPATDARTSRQQFQRAFAQEFLCPIDALLERIQTTEPDEDDISEAAAHFHVSPLMVRTTLVNRGQLDREALNWVDRTF